MSVDIDCRSPVCDRPSWVGGLCTGHYARSRTGGRLDTPIRVSLTERVLDLLDVDGGWLDTLYLAERLGAKHRSMLKTLIRLREKGLVRSKTRLRNQRAVPHEWRLS